MSEVAKFVALVTAGVPLGQATNLVGPSTLRDSPAGILLSDAKRLGASLAVAGHQIVLFEAETQRFESEVSQAGAVPLQTRKLLLWLPGLSIVIGQLSGFGTFSALFTPVGLIAALVAAGLILIGIKWSSRMVSELKKPVTHPGFNLMRLGLAIHSGQSLALVEPEIRASAQDLIELAKRTGAPLSNLIESEIQSRTTLAQLEAMTRAKQLSVQLLVPMGLTVLPAFFILTIVPMFLGIGF